MIWDRRPLESPHLFLESMAMMKMSLLKRAVGGFVLTLTLFTVAGCGSSEKPAGTVSGKVVHNGKPVTGGDVNFSSKSGSAASGALGDGGTFKIDGSLEVGEYVVYLSPPPIGPVPPGQKPQTPKKIDVPKKFQSPSTSTATITLKSGANDVTIELKD